MLTESSIALLITVSQQSDRNLSACLIFDQQLAKEFRYSPQFLHFCRSPYWREYQHCSNIIIIWFLSDNCNNSYYKSINPSYSQQLDLHGCYLASQPNKGSRLQLLDSFTGLHRKEGLLSTACACAKLLDIFPRKISRIHQRKYHTYRSHTHSYIKIIIKLFTLAINLAKNK